LRSFRPGSRVGLRLGGSRSIRRFQHRDMRSEACLRPDSQLVVLSRWRWGELDRFLLFASIAFLWDVLLEWFRPTILAMLLQGFARSRRTLSLKKIPWSSTRLFCLCLCIRSFCIVMYPASMRYVAIDCPSSSLRYYCVATTE